MNNRLMVFLLVGTLGTGSVVADELSIEPVFQQTPVWCWAAVGEMVFRHYGVANINPGNNFQCGIIALLHPICNQNCFNCVVPAGSLATMNNMLTQYPTFASGVTRTRTRLSTRVRRTRLSLTEVQSEIDAGRPVVAGISPSGYNVSGMSEHVALIVGYDESELVVNDPFPFDSNFFTGDPYESAGGEQLTRGQYKINYRAFANRLQWRETIYGIRCIGGDCDESGGDDDDDIDTRRDRREESRPAVEYGRSCSTPITRCGPFYNQPAQPLGTDCWCPTPYGPSSGRVVRP